MKINLSLRNRFIWILGSIIMFPFLVFGQPAVIHQIDQYLSRVEQHKTESLKSQEYIQLNEYIHQQPLQIKPELFKHIFSKDSTDLALKSLTLEFANSLYDSGKKNEAIDLYLDIIWKYITLENDSALFFSDQLAEFAKQKNTPEGLAKALETKGLYYEIVESDKDRALNLYFDAIDICESNKLEYLAEIYHTVGVMFHLSDNFEKAKRYYTSSLNEAVKHGNLKVQKKCLINLGSVNSSLKEYGVAEDYLLQSLEINIDSGKDYDTYANLGNLYMRQNDFEKALTYFEKATVIHPDNSEAEANLRFLIDVKTSLKDSSGMQEVLKRAKANLLTQKTIREKSLMTRSISNYYKSIGDYEKALEYQNEYINLYSDIIENQNEAIFLELEAKYQSEKINAALAKKEKQKQFLIIGLFFLLATIIAVLLFYKKRLKYQKTISKQKEELQQQQIKELQQKNKMIAMNSMVSGQEAERKRIARDLHDGLGGVLSTIKTYHSILKQNLPHLSGHEGYLKTDALIDEACGEVRRISHNMMPHALSLSGLESALTDLGETLNQDGIITRIEIDNIKFEIADTRAVMIYRLVQEIVNNIKKHSQAKHALVQLICNAYEIIITLEDDGVGFDTTVLFKNKGLGLTSVQSRVEFLDGTLDVDSVPNKGTTITIKIPAT